MEAENQLTCITTDVELGRDHVNELIKKQIVTVKFDLEQVVLVGDAADRKSRWCHCQVVNSLIELRRTEQTLLDLCMMLLRIETGVQINELLK